jgi:hypothetical protein
MRAAPPITVGLVLGLCLVAAACGSTSESRQVVQSGGSGGEGGAIVDIERTVGLGETCLEEWLYCGAEEGRYAGMCRAHGAEILCERKCRTEQADCDAGQICEPVFEGDPYGTCSG